METLVKADIFFFVTTIVIVLVGILSVIILLYVVSIARQIKRMAEIAHKELLEIAEDIDDVRQEIRSGARSTQRTAQNIFSGFSFARTVTFLVNTILEARQQKKRKRTRRGNDE